MKLSLTLTAMFVLAVVSHSTSQTSSPTPATKSAQTRQVAPKVLEEPSDDEFDAAQKGETWMRVVYADRRDGHKFVVFLITSTNHLRVLKDTELISLNVICDKGDVFLGLQTYAAANADVALQVDDAHSFRQKWLPNGTMLMSPSSDTFLSQAVDAKVLKIGFIPTGRDVLVAAFKMSNLKELIAKEKVCHK